ncbi:hypothetical protein JCM8547_002962 [Rhodosporidiobolus lusitaniae]
MKDIFKILHFVSKTSLRELVLYFNSPVHLAPGMPLFCSVRHLYVARYDANWADSTLVEALCIILSSFPSLQHLKIRDVSFSRDLSEDAMKSLQHDSDAFLLPQPMLAAVLLHLYTSGVLSVTWIPSEIYRWTRLSRSDGFQVDRFERENWHCENLGTVAVEQVRRLFPRSSLCTPR